MFLRGFSKCNRSLSPLQWTRSFASKPFDYEVDLQKIDIQKIRNTGIIAHIDAGKTTTTERMLYYSGLTARIGNVDQGDTVTDYLTQEKDRGITIQSAAVTLPWNGYKINLIDTPGHADFTFEVIRSLRVLDGGVAILDAVAGVEAQTEKVWRQAKDMQIPMLCYINKMDREGAGYGRTVKEIAGRLGTRAVLVNIPYFTTDQTQQPIFQGVIDVIDGNLLKWDETDPDGQKVQVMDLMDASHDPKLHEECVNARQAAIELLGEYDEAVIDSFLETEDYMEVPSATIKSALRRATLDRWATPIICGSSFKNIGVQPLLDAVIDYLPSPTEVAPPEVVCSPLVSRKKNKQKQQRQDLPVKMDPKLGCIVNNDKNLTTSLAFKVIMHPNRGLMTFVRVYSGKLQPNSIAFNTRTGEKIKIGKLLIMNGDVPQEVKVLSAGNIGVVTGTDQISTGDTLISHAISKNVAKIPRNEATAKLLPIKVPPPVFSVSLEPATVADKRKLDSSLEVLLKEDPSLKLDYDEESDQQILSGMGELHLEITRDRLINDMKVNAEIGPVKVTYKETLTAPSTTVERKMDAVNGEGSYDISLSIEPFEGPVETTQLFREDGAHALDFDNNLIIFEKNSTPEFVTKALDSPGDWPLDISYESMLNALISGVTGSLQVGGQIARLPLHSVAIRIHSWSLPVDATSVAPLLQVTRLAVKEAIESLPESAATILEPLMNVSVYVNDENLGVVTQDLMSARNANIMSIDEQDASGSADDAIWAREQADRTYIPYDPTLQYTKGSLTGGKKVIHAEAPLKEMIGYLNKVRSLTQGRGIFDMEYKGMQRTTPDRVKEILG